MTNDGSPSELILKRCRAFVEGDFAFIYDTHHPDSFFRRIYPDRDSYENYGRSTLREAFRIRECRILHEEVTGDLARVIYYLDSEYKGERLESFELCRLRREEGGGWLYQATQKLERREFSGDIEGIGWDDFDRIDDKLEF
jgi:SEC-C motif domain protein